MYIIKVNDLFLSYNSEHSVLILVDKFVDPNEDSFDREYGTATCLFTNKVEASKAICNEEFWFMMPDHPDSIKIEVVKM